MANKRGQIFALYLVILTLLMCGLIIGMHHLQSKEIDNSLVSPKDVLEFGDKVNVFELWERSVLKKLVWGTKLEEDFCGEFASTNTVDFIFDALIFEGKPITNVASRENFCFTVYDFNVVGGGLKVGRDGFSREFFLKANDRAKIDFPVNVEFDFEKEYVINVEDRI